MSETLKQMQEDYLRYQRSLSPPAPPGKFRQQMAAIGSFVGGISVLALLFLFLWLCVKVIKFLWFL